MTTERKTEPTGTKPTAENGLCLVVASHGVLDAFSTYGEGIAFLAPISAVRWKSPVRPFSGVLPEIVVFWVPAFVLTRYWSKRTIIITSAMLFVLAVGLSVANSVISVGTAYKAKVLCSEVFVAGRNADAVLSEMLVDDLRALRWIGATVDTTFRTTRARFFVWPERTAWHDETLGCVLGPPGENRPSNLQPLRARGVIASTNADSAFVAPPVRTALDSILTTAFSEPDPEHLRRTRAVVVMQHGKIVAERYAAGVGPDTPLIGWSMTKSVMNALIGIATANYLLSPSDSVRVAEWGASGDDRTRITIDDLLRMSSGLRFDEAQTDLSSHLFKMLYGAHDMAGLALNQPLEADPGTRWRYSSGTTLILSRLLRNTLGDDVYHEFPRVALFEPLGMTHAIIEADASGTFVGSSYMYATAREWARIGQLYLQDGVWNGQRMLPEEWVSYSRTPAPAAPDATYGAHFWLKTPQEYRGSAVTVPRDMFQAVGHEGQFVSIIPSHDVVIARLGRTRLPSAWEHDRFVAAVLAALAPPASTVTPK